MRETALIIAPRHRLRQWPSAAAFRRLRQLPGRVVGLLREWRERSRSRSDLAKFDDRMLRDIGISRADVWHEINKPFWRK